MIPHLRKSELLTVSVALLIIASACSLFASGSTNGAIQKNPAEQTAPAAPGKATPVGKPAAHPTVPADWVVSKDPSGSCQVSAPPSWTLGKDFFLVAEKTNTVQFGTATVHLPPTGKDLWPTSQPQGSGTHYQTRRTVIISDALSCSVYRIQDGTDFTGDQQREMDQVGATLQEVQK